MECSASIYIIKVDRKVFNALRKLVVDRLFNVPQRL